MRWRTFSMSVLYMFVTCALLASATALACDPPAKPSKVSTSAVWVGGCDGGVWIEIRSLEKSRAKLKIYSDSKGDLVKSAWFVMGTGCEIQNKSELEKKFDAYDGESVILNKKDPAKPGFTCVMKAAK